MNQLQGTWKKIVGVVAVSLSGFHLYTGVFGLLPSLEQRAVHVGLALTLVFALHPWRKDCSRNSIPWHDVLLIGVVLASTGNIFFRWPEYVPIMQEPATVIELALAVTAVLVILESTRRITGWIFPMLAALSIAYALWGEYIPGEFGHPHIAWTAVLRNIYFSTQAMWGFLTGLSSAYIALFIMFGGILLSTGAGKTFIDLTLLLAGRFRGGPAKVSVIASGMFAMLSGSPLANVATTGTFTIPMMKKLGYSPEFAAGVEATASTGGTLTPPVMGASAFIMAEFLGISYLKVCIAAAIPAFLFYLSVLMGVHFRAVKLNLMPVPPEDRPTVKSVVTYSRMACLLVPIGVLLYTLIAGYSLILVSTSACLAALVTYIFSTISWSEVKERLWYIPDILRSGAVALSGIVPILVAANIVLSLLSYTGLGIKFAAVVASLGEAHLLLSLVITALLVMILGCGLPATAAYVLGVTVAVPLLTGWGILATAAHLFVLYYSVLAVITPPVCAAVFLGAEIAQANWMKTAGVAVRLAPLLYLMPFLFVFDNSFIMVGSPWSILVNVSTGIVGVLVLAGGTMGQLLTKCNIPERVVLVGSGLILLLPGWLTDLLGIGLASAIVAKQIVQRRGEVGL
jgi:TRAP transporter 4TM/12TM fusion protein